MPSAYHPTDQHPDLIQSSASPFWSWLERDLGGVREEEGGRQILALQNVRVQLDVYEGARAVSLEGIHCIPKGTGTGSRVVESLRSYADSSGKQLHIVEIENDDFFDRFPFWTERWWIEDEMPGSALYDPQQT